MSDPFLRRHEVEREVGLSTTTLYRMMNRGEFPRGHLVSRNARRWRQSEITKWKDDFRESEAETHA